MKVEGGLLEKRKKENQGEGEGEDKEVVVKGEYDQRTFHTCMKMSQ
jgi:hypothetical protein